jgi:hypothetical protein
VFISPAGVRENHSEGELDMPMNGIGHNDVTCQREAVAVAHFAENLDE